MRKVPAPNSCGLWHASIGAVQRWREASDMVLLFFGSAIV